MKIGSPNERTGFRSSRSQMFFKIGVLKNFAKISTRKHLLESLFNKVWGLKNYNSIKKRFQHRCFSLEFAQFFLKEQLQWLLLRFNSCFERSLKRFYDIFIIKSYRIKWDVIICLSFKMLVKVWIWYRCQNRLKKHYYHDGGQLAFHKNVNFKTRRLSKKEDVFVIFVLQETKNPNLFDKTQPAKRHLKDVLKMSYEDTQDISARCLLDA